MGLTGVSDKVPVPPGIGGGGRGPRVDPDDITAVARHGLGDVQEGHEPAVDVVPHQGGGHEATVGQHHVQLAQGVVLLEGRGGRARGGLERVVDGLAVDRLKTINAN